MTVTNLVGRTFQLLRDPARQKYDPTYILSYLNDGERLFCSQTAYSVMKDQITVTVAQQGEYLLPTDYKSDMVVIFKSNPLERTSLDQTLLAGTSTGEPIAYYIRNNYIGLYPAPSTAGDTLTIAYYSTGGALVNNSDVPIIPTEHQNLLPFYAAYICCLEGDDTRAAFFSTEWERGLARAKIDVTTKAFGSKPIIVGGKEWTPDPIDHDIGGF